MPEYEYKCKECKQVFVIERSMSDSSSVNCTQCNSSELSRIWSANFLGVNSKASTTSSGQDTSMCGSNPSLPKSCCPCGPSASSN